MAARKSLGVIVDSYKDLVRRRIVYGESVMD